MSRPASRLLACLLAVLMVGSVVAPVGAVGAPTGPSDGGGAPASGAGAGTAGPAGPTDATPAEGTGPKNGTPVRGLDGDVLPTDSGGPMRGLERSDDGRVTAVVALAEDANGSVGTYAARLRDRGVTVRAVSGRSVSVRIDADEVDALRGEPWVERVRRPFGTSTTVVSEGVETIDADAVQKAGITGENASVGILDITGFDVNGSEISDNVVDFKSFSGEIDRYGSHGTAVTEVVADTAPDADLYVAKFGGFVSYRKAVDWVLDQGVDVVVMSVAFYGQPNDGTGPVSEVAEWAPENDTTWVNAAGNDAQIHWQGEFTDGDGDGVHNFSDEDELNYLNGGQEFDTYTRVRTFLTWENWHATDQDYDLYLVNGSGTVVARSTYRQDGDDRAYEVIDETVDAGEEYAIVVKKQNATGDQRLELFALGGGQLQYRNATGSITAPAVGNGITAVGAVDYSDESLEYFSSWGPSNDGRQALDLVGPDRVSTEAYGPDGFPGTSAAAPHVGGVAALVESVNDSLSAADLEDLLTDTAEDKRESGVDDATGHGLVDAEAAVARASDTYPPPTPTVTRDAPASVTQGSSVSVTLELEVDKAADRVRLVEKFDPGFAEVAVEAAAVEGEGSVTAVDATTDRVAVEARNLTTASDLVVTYRVTAPTDESGVFGVKYQATVDGVPWSGAHGGISVQEATRPADPGTENVPDERTGTALAGTSGSDADPRVNVSVELAPDAGESPERYADRLRDRGATVGSVSDRWIHAEIDPARATEYRSLDWVADLSRPPAPASAETSEGVGTIDADAVHAAGTTGEDVAVGILDAEGFDLSNAEIADSVVASKSFAGGIGEGGNHGTAVAEVVVDTAPGADLYVANFEDTAGYYEAVQWLRGQGVDVIVMAANFYGGPNDGTGAVSNVADGAVGDDIVWVNSAGNDAQNHWEGEFADGDGDGIHNFSSSTEYNFLADGSMLSAGDRVRAWLTWNDWPDTAQDYDLYLFNGSGQVVARSERAQDGDDPPREMIDVTVPESGYYSLAVVNHDADGEATLELFVQEGGPLSERTTAGSLLAPAAGENVTTVGAVDYADTALEPFSGRGPLPDGSQGVDLVGPDRVSTATADPFVGTSAAAPHVAGAAALVAAVNDSLGPAAMEQVLTATADDLGPDGPDPATGYGLVNASAAVDRASPGTETASPGVSVSREAPASVPPGEEATVTTTVTVESATDRLALTESLDPAARDVTVEDAAVEGEGSVLSRLADETSVSVTATGLAAGDTLTVTYRVTAPDGVESVAIDGEVTAGGTTVTAPTTTIAVRAQSDVRSLSRSSVPPGGEVTVTTTVEFDQAADRVSIAEQFPSGVTASVEDVAIDGEGSVLFSNGGDGSVSVALQGVGAGTTVAVTYALSVPDSYEEGDSLTIQGSVTAGETRSLGSTVVPVEGGLSAYADDDGVVDTEGIRAAIADWAADEISTDFLRQVIQAWASGEEVARIAG